MSEDEALASFLDKVDKISDLVKELNSADVEKSETAMKKADAYLQSAEVTGFDRTLINTNNESFSDSKISVSAEDCAKRDENMSDASLSSSNKYLRALEEDAKERSERKKAKEKIGKEHKKLGNIAFKQGDFASAIASYSEAIQQMPWDVTLYTNRAQAYFKTCSYQLALDDCNAALKIKPDHFKALIHKGKALGMLKDFDQAHTVYIEAQNVNPSDHQLIQGYIDQLEAQRTYS